jgi:hypothetical protein
MDQFANDDSTSNQSDSSSSSTNPISRQQQLLHGNIYRSAGVQSVQYETLTSRDEQEQSNKTSVATTKRGLITKNISNRSAMGQKRRRYASGSDVIPIKREPQPDPNDDVSLFIH